RRPDVAGASRTAAGRSIHDPEPRPAVGVPADDIGGGVSRPRVQGDDHLPVPLPPLGAERPELIRDDGGGVPDWDHHRELHRVVEARRRLPRRRWCAYHGCPTYLLWSLP